MASAATATQERTARVPRAEYGPGVRLVGRARSKTYTGTTFATEGKRIGIKVDGGKEYGSLSAAAKEITGYSVSGNVWWKPEAGEAKAATRKAGDVLTTADGAYSGKVIQDADGMGFEITVAKDAGLIGNVYDSPEAFATEIAGAKAATFWSAKPAPKATAAKPATPKTKAIRAPRRSPKLPAKKTAAPKAAAKPRAKKATAA